jgi:hypothetical protein
MLRSIKTRFGLRSLFILTFVSAIGNHFAMGADDIPTGYKADRYQPVWERNPFTLVTPLVLQAQAKPFEKFVLISWLNDGGKDVVFVQNTETSEVQKITKDPNQNSLRLVAIHKAADLKNAEAVISNGTEEGSVKFRLEMPAAAPQGGQQQSKPTVGAQNPIPGGPASLPGMPRQMPQNAQQARMGANQQGMQPGAAGTPPRAVEVRRKRITPPPVIEQQVGTPTPDQNLSNQPQTQ